jgi:predicted MFS family arabinose efflux permease
MTATSLAVVVTNGAVPVLGENFDWPCTYRILGVVNVLAGIVCLALIRDGRPTGPDRALEKPDFSPCSRSAISVAKKSLCPRAKYELF